MPTTGTDTRRDMLADMWRTLTTRTGWTRYNDAAGTEWGAQYTPTGAVVIPRAGVTGRGRRWADWLVCIPPTPHTFDPCDSLGGAVAFAESLPPVSPVRPEPTHYDGHGAACWCDQPSARR